MTQDYEDPTEKIQIEQLKKLGENNQHHHDKVPSNQGEFEKFLLKEPDQFSYISSLTIPQYALIFEKPLNSELFLRVLETLITSIESDVSDSKVEFCKDFLRVITKAQDFDFTVSFFSEKDLDRISTLIGLLKCEELLILFEIDN